MTSTTLDAAATAQALPFRALADAIVALLRDPTVHVPARLVQPLPAGGSLFVMPAVDARIAITKLISFVADNPAQGLPAIQGDIVVFDAQRGQRLALIDGPTVTARRTAAVSLVAAQRLAPRTDGPMLIVGAGVQGLSHLQAFHAGLGVREVLIASRTPSHADHLVAMAKAMGLRARRVEHADEVVNDCPLIVSCTSAQQIAVSARPPADGFIAAVGAFTPTMVEWAPDPVRWIAENGRIVVDTRDADHEAGDLLQAGLDVSHYPSLADVIRVDHDGLQTGPTKGSPRRGPVFFKSCGWAGWDLAAARCLVQQLA